MASEFIRHSKEKRQSHTFVSWLSEAVGNADGTKLRTIHRSLGGANSYIDSIDYIGNLILKNGQPSMYLFEGGYATFNSNGAVNGWHYYIQDYMGNNRMVVNKNGTTEQVTHYYPYGGVIGDISTNENVQKYKFEGPRSHQKEIDNLLARRRAFRRGVELDRTFGLDNYDIHARQYFAMMPSWDRIDKYAEKYYSISPYSYCGGDPVNRGDYNGKYISLGDNPSWSLISGYAIARAELSRVGADKNLRALEMDMTSVVTIVEIRPDDCDGNQFDYKSNTIFWSPERGSIRQVDLEDSSLGTYTSSPVEGLQHEADHGQKYNSNKEEYIKDLNTEDEQFKNKEERRVVTGSEQETARALGRIIDGQVTRKHHMGGKTIRVSDPLSTTPLEVFPPTIILLEFQATLKK